ncbi:bifunctional adenosylcobinamide kinase/adenosylcobinamide-phosphate guanylyltransferase [Halomonas caseinilytica]|mgnify:CR=1 FL=1|uniref:bifunctional adenosylcobinamide kinase/adenosylcobinamide-phosphate guanylyltransferase n=1 Tax=Halomonas caseinilytica TaxID=438744 RepID=UPI0007E530CC|nr:bifunctional adenosylcobinamide kinase/adenosylcobinamide-phosphate guanylyltransferase [Halomonas caseinilytica]SEN18304.1 adenosylcobinamide kinase /adenosylcobinamide-phosphate guanylyltransferase [Halomonas caseinilytica]
MQLFIGGACAGKRDLVAARFPDAVWHRLDPDAPESWRDALVPGAPLVLTGWASWLEGALEDDSDDDRLRARLAAMLETLVEVEAGSDGEVVLILPEMGRGIVPVDAADRRLRDLSGWLAQDAAARAAAVWYVRHGLARRL